MPYPNEIAARQMEPAGMTTCRRTNNKFGKGIHGIFCRRRADGKWVLQSIRSDRDKFTADEARAWLKRNEFKTEVE